MLTTQPVWGPLTLAMASRLVTAWCAKLHLIRKLCRIRNGGSSNLAHDCVRGIPDPVRAPALQHSGGRSDGLFGLPVLGLSLVGSLQGRSAIHSCNSTVGHAWRGLNSLLWLALSWGLLGLVIYTTTMGWPFIMRAVNTQ